jgi:mRNA interferase MazF
MKKGDIVLVTFPFTDLSSSKQRPALVLFSENEDAVLAFITSKLSFRHTHDVFIEQSAENNLETDSVIILRKLFTGSKKLIRGKIGDLDRKFYPAINNSISALFNL